MLHTGNEAPVTLADAFGVRGPVVGIEPQFAECHRLALIDLAGFGGSELAAGVVDQLNAMAEISSPVWQRPRPFQSNRMSHISTGTDISPTGSPTGIRAGLIRRHGISGRHTHAYFRPGYDPSKPLLKIGSSTQLLM